MAQKTRTSQVLEVVKVLAWVVIAVALVKFAFFPAVQKDEDSDGMDPGGNFGQMTIEVGRADITNTVSVTGTIQADEPVVARATLDGNVVRTFVNDGDKISKGDAIVQIRKEFPGETRQVTDEEGNVSVETSEPTYKYETVVSPGDGTVSTGPSPRWPPSARTRCTASRTHRRPRPSPSRTAPRPSSART